ncbi:MAG: type II toxin-antitoxin system RelE/ParE family toxin [Actinomycetota bacterium]|nr:type II toxin-antitoxin system RelE/ParE family toxin [Actinomycetota bacterium]
MPSGHPDEWLGFLSSGTSLRVTRPAARAIANELPESVASAVVEFITGDLLREPRRVGKPLSRELEGRWAARRGAYRVLYTIDEQVAVVTVLVAEHRRDVYRRR